MTSSREHLMFVFQRRIVDTCEKFNEPLGLFTSEYTCCKICKKLQISLLEFISKRRFSYEFKKESLACVKRKF
jgi:hypothetical protein